MKLIFIGAQGSGKGTQAKKVAEKFELCHISTGDALREVIDGRLQVAKGVKEEVEKCVSEGRLVSDELIVKILRDKLKSSEYEKGFILDGFPRNSKQAEMLDEITDIDKVIEILISDDESVRRISGRRGCVKCGAIFNVNTQPKPSVEGVCDKCGGKLIQRKDDNEEALRERLKVYHEETEMILERYDVISVDGERSIESIFEDIIRVLN